MGWEEHRIRREKSTVIAREQETLQRDKSMDKPCDLFTERTWKDQEFLKKSR